MLNRTVFIFIILIIFIIKIDSLAQINNELYCKYTLQARLDSNNTNYTANEIFYLVRKDNRSLFQSVNGYIRDSLLFSGIKGGSAVADANRSKAPRTKFTAVVMKTGNKVVTYDNIYTSRYFYEENEVFSWKISNEFKKIGELKCQKASTNFAGRVYEAWFTRDIAVSDGPYKFSGLPGLIIQLYDLKKDYIFNLSSIKYKAYDVKEPYARSKQISKSDFVKSYNNFRNNAIDILAAKGKNYGNSVEIKKRYNAMIEKENNPIELK